MPSVKEIYSKISDVTIDADSINLNTDTVESLLSTVQTDIALIKADMANGVLVNGTVTANTGLTQPLTDTQLRATAVPVSGTFWPTTQPVSGTVSVSNFPATQPVSGTVGLDSTSLDALENISVTFPDTQNVNVKNVPAITATGANHPVTSFTASTKTILIANFPTAPVIGNFLLITNTKLGVIVHNSSDPQKICTFGSPSYNGQFFSITATFPASVDTAGMQNSDTFHVVYAPVAIGNPLASQVELVGRTQSGGTSSALMSTDRTGALQVDAGVTSPLGAINESAATTDTASSGINGLLKRLLQRITTLIYPPFASGSFTNSGGASNGIDCGGYDYLVQHISGGGGGLNRPIQWSSDNVNWVQGGVVFRHLSNAGSSSTGNEAHWTVMGDILGSTSGIFVIPVLNRYFRVGVGTTAGGGSWTHNWYLHKGPFQGLVEEGIGARNSTAATTDTSDVGLNGLFKRLLQRLTTLLPANLTVSSTRLLVDGSGVTQPVSLASVPSHPVTGTFWQATQPVSLASAPVTPVSDNGGSLTVDGSITATQSTAASLKAQAQLLNSAGTVVDYAMTGTAGTPATDVVSVQGIAGATAIPVSGTVTANTGLTQPLTDTQLRATSVPVSGTVNTYPQQGSTVTNSNFTSTTSATLVSAVANREVLTVHNEGPSTLFINAGTSASTTSYQVRLLAGDYWEAPAGQQSLQHSGIFSSAGSTARVTEIS